MTVVAVIAMVIFGIRLIDEIAARGVHIFSLVLSLVVLALATFGRNTLVKDARTNRPMALGAAFAIILLALLASAVMGVSDSVRITTDVATMICVWVVFSAAAGVVLTVPRPIQDELGLSEHEQSVSSQDIGPLAGTEDDTAERPSPPETADADVHADDESLWAVHPDDEGPDEVSGFSDASRRRPPG
uniref:DUF7937 domain-containing protein n=1 Tax=Phytoactinopolyspora halotolerans TaxID=1981512 RepID=UPI001C204814|nr:hypothetical protein [Phytoactinopolyspora halotolerans]